MKKIYSIMGLAFAAALFTQAHAQNSTVVSFENQTLNEDGFWIGDTNGEGITNDYGGTTYLCSYEEGGLKFNISNSVYYWSGYAISSRTETSYVNLDPDQYNNVTGKAHSGSQFMVAYPYGETIDVVDEAGTQIQGLYFTNSSFLEDAVLRGTDYSTAFVTGDWQTMTVTGYANGVKTGSVNVYLADYRSENPADHSYVKDWTWLDLSSLGTVQKIEISFDSSQSNEWGMLTPAYACIDDVTLAVNTGITNADSSDNHPSVVKNFNLSGRQQLQTRGLNLQRMSDGTVRKVLVK